MREKAVSAIFCLLFLASCSTTNILHLKYKKNYREVNAISLDTTTIISQSVAFNIPRVIDEEFWYLLTFEIKDTVAVKRIRLVNLATDTTIIKTKYDFISPWNWENENYTLSGTIQIIKWTDGEVRLRQKIKIYDLRRNETIRFFGKRTFKKM